MSERLYRVDSDDLGRIKCHSPEACPPGVRMLLRNEVNDTENDNSSLKRTCGFPGWFLDCLTLKICQTSCKILVKR